jgi:dUTP pyrophosphatase
VLEIPLVRLDLDLPTPSYAKLGDAGCDLVARAGALLAPAGGRATIATGIALAIPKGYAGLVLARSGLASRHGIGCLNAPGLIDPGYRGEVAVILVNTDRVVPYEVHRGDRIAQLVICRVEQVRFLAVDELEATERGEGGFGHSGR